MKLSDPKNLYAQPLDTIKTLLADGSLWQREAAEALAAADQDTQDVHQLIELTQKIRRLNGIAVTGLGADTAFKDVLTAEKNAVLWHDFADLKADPALQESLAEKLYNIRPGKNDVGLIKIGESTRAIAEYLVTRCQNDGAPFLMEVADPAFQALLLNHASEDGVKALAADYCRWTAPATRIMTARENSPMRTHTKTNPEKSKLYTKGVQPFSERVSSGDLFYTLTAIPTEKDAAIDGIPYNDYMTLFFEMCDQPWDEISRAQQALILEFNKASTVRITNDDGTDVSMSLIDVDGSHFTFCNSLIAKNVPGSELFSAPRLDSVEGIVVAKGKFGSSGKIENLTLEFEKGKLVRYKADKGLEEFERAISIDEGAKMVGELGIGTNPHLKQHVANGLLVEKIGGSFHLALGRCYTYTMYGDDPVKVDNGNQSGLHWDITTMLYGKNGRIYLDGRLVMDKGFWIDPKYDVLNRGWAAMPENKRPAYWQKKLAA